MGGGLEARQVSGQDDLQFDSDPERTRTDLENKRG
jgi:hypothetical protein